MTNKQIQSQESSFEREYNVHYSNNGHQNNNGHQYSNNGHQNNHKYSAITSRIHFFTPIHSIHEQKQSSNLQQGNSTDTSVLDNKNNVSEKHSFFDKRCKSLGKLDKLAYFKKFTDTLSSLKNQESHRFVQKEKRFQLSMENFQRYE